MDKVDKFIEKSIGILIICLGSIAVIIFIIMCTGVWYGL